MDPTLQSLIVRALILLAGAAIGVLGYRWRTDTESVNRIIALETLVAGLSRQIDTNSKRQTEELVQIRESFMHRGEAIARFRVLDDMQRALNRIEGRVDKLVERA